MKRDRLIGLALMVVALTATDTAKPCLDRLSLLMGGALLAACGLFSLAGTHDYLAESRTRWEALHDLTEVAHIPPTQIAGGCEFFASRGYDWTNPARRWPDGLKDSTLRPAYVLSFGPMGGFEEVKRYPFRRWLPIADGHTLVLYIAS